MSTSLQNKSTAEQSTLLSQYFKAIWIHSRALSMDSDSALTHVKWIWWLCVVMRQKEQRVNKSIAQYSQDSICHQPAFSPLVAGMCMKSPANTQHWVWLGQIQHWRQTENHNVAATLPQHYNYVVTTLLQCYNVGYYIRLQYSHIRATSCEHCVNTGMVSTD